MPQVRCPRCNQVVTYMEHTKDYVHNCSSGNPTVDQEDYLDLGMQNWNLRGIENSKTGIARIEGADNETLTRRGRRSSVFKQRQHQEFIILED